MFLLYEHGVAAMDRRSFGSLGAENQHYMRLSFVADLSSLNSGVDGLEKASNDRDGFFRFFKQHQDMLARGL